MDPGDHEPRVYFVRAENGLIKIGVTTSVNKRLKCLQNSSPVHLELLAHMPGDGEDERALHLRFNAHRQHGEWFKPANAILACITDALKHDQTIPKQPPRNSKSNFAADWMTDLWGLKRQYALQVLADEREFVKSFYDLPSGFHIRVMLEKFGHSFCNLTSSLELFAEPEPEPEHRPRLIDRLRDLQAEVDLLKTYRLIVEGDARQ